jgi:hypothetical protein
VSRDREKFIPDAATHEGEHLFIWLRSASDQPLLTRPLGQLLDDTMTKMRQDPLSDIGLRGERCLVQRCDVWSSILMEVNVARDFRTLEMKVYLGNGHERAGSLIREQLRHVPGVS